MNTDLPPKRDLISTFAEIGTPAFICVWLIAMGWKMAALWIGGFAAIIIVLLWIFPPAIDD